MPWGVVYIGPSIKTSGKVLVGGLLMGISRKGRGRRGLWDGGGASGRVGIASLKGENLLEGGEASGIAAGTSLKGRNLFEGGGAFSGGGTCTGTGGCRGRLGCVA